MLHVFRLLLLLINIDQETVLNWFGIEDLTNQKIRQSLESDSDLTFLNIHSSSDVSLETFRLILLGLWGKIQKITLLKVFKLG